MSEENKLTQDIYQAISKNLSGQVADTLKSVLEEYQDLKIQVEQQEDLRKDQRKQYQDLEKECSELRGLTIKKGNLDLKEIELEDREKKLDIKLLNKDKECAEAKVKLMENNFNMVFRNVDIVRDKLGNVPVINRCSDGQQYITNETANITETEKKE